MKRKGEKLFLGRNSLPTWDARTFLRVARDRGYASMRAVIYTLSRELNVTPQTIERMLSSGRFKWEHILFLGDYFEMTPKEFCDVFLHGYFAETRNGNYRAKFENARMLLDRRQNVQTREQVFGDKTEFEETIFWN